MMKFRRDNVRGFLSYRQLGCICCF